jgi:hypothetical protein
MEIAMPLMFLTLCSYWWKAALKPKEQASVIVLMPEEEAPELAVTTSTLASYQG